MFHIDGIFYFSGSGFVMYREKDSADRCLNAASSNDGITLESRKLLVCLAERAKERRKAERKKHEKPKKDSRNLSLLQEGRACQYHWFRLLWSENFFPPFLFGSRYGEKRRSDIAKWHEKTGNGMSFTIFRPSGKSGWICCESVSLVAAGQTKNGNAEKSQHVRLHHATHRA